MAANLWQIGGRVHTAIQLDVRRTCYHRNGGVQATWLVHLRGDHATRKEQQSAPLNAICALSLPSPYPRLSLRDEPFAITTPRPPARGSSRFCSRFGQD